MSISLEGALRTCKVDTAWAARADHYRRNDPTQMQCPVWSGMDTAGRYVCPDSFTTKREGCNSSLDRITVENYQRPSYSSYINLDAEGIQGDLYGSRTYRDVVESAADLKNINNFSGNFGLQFGANVYPGCGINPYQTAMAEEAQCARMQQAGYARSMAQANRCCAGV